MISIADTQARAACAAFYEDPRELSFGQVAVDRMKRAIEAALADHEPTPFVLNENERAALDGDYCASASTIAGLRSAVRRALKTLGPKPPTKPDDYSDAQVDAALSAWGESNWSFLDEDIRRRNTRTMRAALAAASVPAHPKQPDQPVGMWTEHDYRMAVKAFARDGGPYPDDFTEERIHKALDGVAYRLEGWTADQAVGIAELLEMLDIEDDFMSNPPVWKALLANYVEARAKTPEHAAEIRENCAMAKVAQPFAQTSWTQADLDNATDAMLDFRKSGDDWTGKPTHAAQAVLGAVQYRLTAAEGQIARLESELASHKDALATASKRADDAETSYSEFWRKAGVAWQTWADETLAIAGIEQPHMGKWGHDQLREKLGMFVRLAKAVEERCISLDEQTLALQDKWTIESDFSDDDKHPLEQAFERLQAAATGRADRVRELEAKLAEAKARLKPLTTEERKAVADFVAHVTCTGYPSNATMQTVAELLLEGRRINDALSEDERAMVEHWRTCDAITSSSALTIVDRLAPPPKPARKTARELANELLTGFEDSRALNIMEELVRRAEAGEP